MKRLEAWRAQQSGFQRGCGCFVLILISVMCAGMMLGAMMGDYIGPPESAADDAQSKARTLLGGLVGIAAAITVGSWLIRPVKR